jgi:hypothetical protein
MKTPVRIAGRDFNSGPPKYVAEVLTTSVEDHLLLISEKHLKYELMEL